MVASEANLAFYKTAEYAEILANEIISWVCNKLDSDDLGYQLFDKCREKETAGVEDDFENLQYNTMVMGALIMRAGAKIRPGYAFEPW